LTRGWSLNEYGLKHLKTGKLTTYTTEEALYKALGMDWMPPELREDRGEIPTAVHHKLPKLIETSDIRGDLHMHTKYDLQSSHDVGANSLVEHLQKAEALGYEYIGISDHNPRQSGHTEKDIAKIMEKRKAEYEHQYSVYRKTAKKPVAYFTMCEVDIQPDGQLALPTAAFEFVDAVVVSLHSSFTLERSVMTKRVIAALTGHPKVRIFGHPTGRLLGKREGVDLNWPEVFAICKKLDIALEINAYPDRLDLPDGIVYEAVKANLKLCIDTDAHAVEHMELMRYGVSVARRGWATKRDIVNSLGYNEFKKWLMP
jgi:DNA polymerase (family 10)